MIGFRAEIKAKISNYDFQGRPVERFQQNDFSHHFPPFDILSYQAKVCKYEYWPA